MNGSVKETTFITFCQVKTYETVMSQYRIPASTAIGHVHLKVSDLERSLDFYTRVLGFELTQKYGAQAAFVSAGGYHHHIGLNTWQSQGSSPSPTRSPGLFHLAILLPTRKDLALAYENLRENGVTIDGSADHGVSEAIYFRDPDENGIEIYWDRNPELWPRDSEGNLRMTSDELNLRALLEELK
jgi:catechol 2,3-dioxygenase